MYCRLPIRNDKVHVKQTDLCARANNVNYEDLDDECCSISGCYPVPRALTLNFEDDLDHKSKGHIRIQRPKLDI